MAIAIDAFFVPHSLRKRLPHGDADILDSVVVIDVPVTFGFDLKIHQPVTCNLIEHVLQKRYSRIKRGASAAIQIDGDPDLRLQRIAFDFGCS